MAVEEGTEYGGVSGLIQPADRGHDVLEVAEAAMIMRSEGRRSAGIDETLPPDDAHWAAVAERRLDRADRLAGRTIEEVDSESLS